MTAITIPVDPTKLGTAILADANVQSALKGTKDLQSTIGKAGANYVKGLKLVVTPPPVITPPPVTTGTSSTFDITKTQRYAIAKYLFCLKANNWPDKTFITSLPAQKGGVSLPYTGSNPAPLALPLWDKGILLMQNQRSTGFWSAIPGAIVPQEHWIVLTKVSYAQWEAVMGAFNLPYLAELNANNIGLRVQSSGGFQYTNFVMPINQPVIIRIVISNINFNPTMQLYVNGSSVGNPMPTQPIKGNAIGIGTDGANCAYQGLSELFITPILTASQASVLNDELTTEYGIGKTTTMPYATPTLVKTANSTTLSYKYSGSLPEDTSKRITKWITWPRGNPDVQNYMPEYQGLMTIPMALIGRAEIQVFDTAGNYHPMPGSAFLQ